MHQLKRMRSVEEVAEILGVPVRTVYGWRHRGEGPRAFRVGKHLRYRDEDIDAWLEQQPDTRRAS